MVDSGAWEHPSRRVRGRTWRPNTYWLGSVEASRRSRRHEHSAANELFKRPMELRHRQGWLGAPTQAKGLSERILLPLHRATSPHCSYSTSLARMELTFSRAFRGVSRHHQAGPRTSNPTCWPGLSPTQKAMNPSPAFERLPQKSTKPRQGAKCCGEFSLYNPSTRWTRPEYGRQRRQTSSGTCGRERPSDLRRVAQYHA
jgi:hypothetical protein